MNPIRCTLHCYWPNVPEDIVPEYEKKFEGKTGTVVWASTAVWGGFQISVELDEPHPIFGKFCNIAYTCTSYVRNTLAEVDDIDRLREFAQVCSWSTFRTKHGDPRPWKEIEKIAEQRIQALREEAA